MNAQPPPDPIVGRMALLADRFRERARADRLALIAAEEESDRPGLRDIAHRLAGLAAMFGFDAVGERASELEDAIDRDAAPDVVHQRTAALIAALEAVP